MRNNKAMKEQTQQYFTKLLNEKATLEWKIDKDQKFIAQMHHELGTEQFLYYKESIQNNQHELSYTIKQLAITKAKLEFYEKI